MLPWKLRKRHILPVNQNLSSVYFSLAKFQLVSCNLSLAMIWQMTYTHKMPKLCSATLNYHAVVDTEISYGFEDGGSWKNLEIMFLTPNHLFFISFVCPHMQLTVKSLLPLPLNL